MKIYAKTCNPEYFDYRMYEDEIPENFHIDGGEDYGFINGDYLNKIEKIIDEFDSWDYDYYYHNSIKDLLLDYMPKKVNGKKLSPKEMHRIKVALSSYNDYRYHSDYVENARITILSIIYGEPYKTFKIRGCCQGDYAEVYAPSNTKQSLIDYIEAIYFATGTEVIVHDELNEPSDASEISGYSFYTDKYSPEDIKQIIAEEHHCSIEDVVLYVFDGYYHMPKYQIQ